MADDERRPPPSRILGKVIKSEVAEAAVAAERAPLAEKAPPAPAPRRGGVLNAEEFEAMTQAKQIIADAQKKSEEIKAEAHRFKEEVFAKAREEAKADVQARAAEELARAKMQAGQLLADTEKDVVELALKMAAKIIGRDLERDPELVLEIAANAIEVVRGSKAMVLKVHPDDGKLLREKRPRLMELIGRAVDIAIRDDDEIERGGCIIQTEFGTIDGQIRTQFEMLRNVLMPDGQKKESK